MVRSTLIPSKLMIVCPGNFFSGQLSLVKWWHQKVCQKLCKICHISKISPLLSFSKPIFIKMIIIHLIVIFITMINMAASDQLFCSLLMQRFTDSNQLLPIFPILPPFLVVIIINIMIINIDHWLHIKVKSYFSPFAVAAPSHPSSNRSKSKQASTNGSSYYGSTTNPNVLTFKKSFSKRNNLILKI